MECYFKRKAPESDIELEPSTSSSWRVDATSSKTKKRQYDDN